MLVSIYHPCSRGGGGGGEGIRWQVHNCLYNMFKRGSSGNLEWDPLIYYFVACF